MRAHTHIHAGAHAHPLCCRFLSRWRHILHGSVTAHNKVQQENLTGIFLFVPELSVNGQTDGKLVWDQPETHTKNTAAAFHPAARQSCCCHVQRRFCLHKPIRHHQVQTQSWKSTAVNDQRFPYRKIRLKSVLVLWFLRSESPLRPGQNKTQTRLLNI